MKHLLLTALLITWLASAQTPAPLRPATDPTVPDAALQQLLMATLQNKGSEASLPTILMRGKIINQTGRGLIIIEVNKQILALKQGSTTIASWGPHSLTGSAQDFAQTLTGGQADSITDYSALRVEFTSALT